MEQVDAKVWRLHCALAATISMVKFLLILAILSCSPITQRFSASCLVIQFAFVNFVIAYNVIYTQQRYKIKLYEYNIPLIL